MRGNFQHGIHPDADQFSVFVEGAATAREHELMLAHLAECAECRKAVFLMQPHEEKQAATTTPVKGWMWRRLLPVGLPAAALACGLIAVLIYFRPRGGTREIQEQNASVSQPEIQLPATKVAPAINPETFARSGRSKKTLEPNAAANASGRENHTADGSNLPKSKNHEIAANVEAPQATAAAPSVAVPGTDMAVAPQSISPKIESESPSNGASLQQLSAAPQAQAAASQDRLTEKKDRPPLRIELINGQDVTLAGVSGQIMDRSGAIIAGATVTLRDPSGKTRQTTTGTDGSFRLTELPAGQYELTATANGFETKKQPIELKPSELAMLQPVLDVGSASETVEVQAAAVQVQSESARASGQVIEGVASADRVIGGPPALPVATTASQGKRFLSLDSAGNLFLSRDGGKKWKKIDPQWAGKAVRIELTPASMSKAPPKGKNETSGQASAVAIFQLTTDANAVWTSKDGKHWHRQ